MADKSNAIQVILATAADIRPPRMSAADKEKRERRKRVFGQAVIDRSEELKLTRKALAKAIGISYQGLVHVENGDHYPSHEVYLKLCSVLKAGKPEL